MDLDLAIPKTTKKQDAAWKFIAWATSKEYMKLVGEKLGWARVPPGTRTSTYEIPEYKEAAAAFADVTLDVDRGRQPEQPGVHPQPWVGVQYVAIPEFQDLGTKFSQEIALHRRPADGRRRAGEGQSRRGDRGGGRYRSSA